MFRPRRHHAVVADRRSLAHPVPQGMPLPAGPPFTSCRRPHSVCPELSPNRGAAPQRESPARNKSPRVAFIPRLAGSPSTRSPSVLCVLAQRSPWFTTKPRARSEGSSATEAYLMPFLAILAAGMAARAMSGGFEWFYALRLVAPLAVLRIYRRQYAQIDWRPSSLWIGILGGILVLVCWAGLDRALGIGAATAMPQPLRDTSPAIRTLWIALRAIAAIVTVPIAEELAIPRLSDAAHKNSRIRFPSRQHLLLARLYHFVDRLWLHARTALARRYLRRRHLCTHLPAPKAVLAMPSLPTPCHQHIARRGSPDIRRVAILVTR